MLDHYLQRAIVYKLALANNLRFSELKPDELENKLFTYHLKKVVAAKLVQKNDDGTYQLTPNGRKLGVHVLDSRLGFASQARAVLLLAVRSDDDGAWLLYRRNNHPLRGRVGFMHVDPIAGQQVTETAKRTLQEKTSLVGDFKVKGSGFITVNEGDDLESFTAFTLLQCSNARGDLVVDDQHADYFWQTDPDFAAEEMLPNMKLLTQKLAGGDPFFAEAILEL